MHGRVLIVAGSDSGGGAGIQADIKTVTALNGFAATAITALTAQNTEGVKDLLGVPPEFVARQMEVVLSDIGADCLKTGMLHTAEVIEAVADVIERAAAGVPLVVDPVMVAKGGERLLERAAVDTMKRRLLIHADVLTPNSREAEILTGMTIRDPDDMIRAARMIHTLGPRAVLLKGGHVPGGTVRDVLVDEAGMEILENPRIESRSTHGTGCTLASGVATGLAQGLGLRAAVTRARAYLQQAIAQAPGLGRAHGPLNHAHAIPPFRAE